MAGYSVGTAFVTVAPSFRGFQTRVGAGISGPLSQAGDQAGTTAGKRFTDRFKAALKVGAVVGGALAVAGAGRFLKESITEASNLGESLNAVNVTFGKNAAGIKRLGKEAADSVGLSRSEFNGLAVQFSAFATTIAGKGGNVTKTMDTLTTRGADFASVMNLDVNEAMSLFQSGLAGETEPLRKFGIDLSAAAVESFALAKGIAKPGEEMTEQQKVQARYQLLMKQTSKTQGDFANTSDSLANVQRRLGANFDNIQATVGSAFLPALEKVSGVVVDKVLPAFSAFLEGMKNGTGAGGRFADIMKGVGKVLAVAGGFIVKYKDEIATFIVVVGGMLIIRKVTTAVKLLNLAMRANPIGMVITAVGLLAAGLVYAYKKSDTFREIVDKAWSTIKKSVKSAWENTIKPALKAFWEFLNKDLMPVVKKLWEKVVKPVFKSVGKAIAFAWDKVIKPALKGLWWYLKEVIFPTVKWLWEKVVKPVFKSVGGAIQDAWTKVIKPALKSLWGFLRDTLFPILKKLWEDVIKPVMTRVGNKIRDVWQDWIKPAFKGIRDGVGKVKNAFKSGVDRIKEIWADLKEATRGPVAFIVNTVYNDGIRKVVNAIPGPIPDLPKIKGFATGGYTGPGPKREIAGVVHKDEHVWTKEEMSHFPGGHERMDRIRAAFRGGGIPSRVVPGDKGLPGFFLGGRVPMPSATSGTSSPSHGTNYYGAWWAGDMNRGSGFDDLGDAVVAWKAGRVADVKYLGNTSYGRYMDINHGSGSSRYAHLQTAIVRDGMRVAAGQKIGTVGNSGQPGMTPHLHFEARGGSSAVSSGSDSSAVYGTGGTGSQNISISNPLSFLDLGGWKDKLSGMGDWGKMMGQMAGNVVPAFTGWAKDKISDIYGAVTGWLKDKLSIPGGDSGSSGSGSGSMNANNLVPIMQQAMNFAKNKWGPAGLNTIYGYANRNIAGTNTKSDHAYGKALDFMTYSNMGLGDQIARYFRGPGSGRFNVENVIWRAPDHYDHVHIDTFDEGGFLPKGMSLAYNGTGGREHKAVLTTDQWRTMKDLARNGERGGMTFNGPITTVDPYAAARAIQAEHHKAAVLAGLR